MRNFPISCWTYFPFAKRWPTLAKDYHDLGLTCPMTPVFSDKDDPADMIALLDEFHALGMKAIVYDYRVTAYGDPHTDEASFRVRFAKSLEQFGSHPAVYGFFVGDEPPAADAAHYFKVARIQREMAPHLVPFLNLLPWFDWISKLIGSPAYAPYLDRAVTEGCLAQIGYDCYTQMWEGDSGWDDYFNNLREMRDCSDRHGIPFCNTLLCSGHFDYLCPDQDDFRWQISTTAALGCRAITYFFVAGLDFRHSYRQFPINHYHERTPAYMWLSEENRFFLDRFGDLLLQLRCEKSEFTQKAYGGLGMFAPDDTLVDARNAKDINMLISTFTGPDGTKYRAVVNLDRKKSIEAKLTFAPGVRVERLGWENKWQDCSGYTDAVGALSADGATTSLWMAPGQLEIIREG